MKNRKRIIIGLAASLLILLCLFCVAGKDLIWEKKGNQNSELQNAKQQEQNTVSDSRDEDNSVKLQEEESSEENDSTQEQEEKSQGEDNSTQKQEEKSSEEILQERIQDKLASMTLEEKAAQLFIITPEALTGYSHVTQAGEATRAALQEYPVGGLVYFEENVVSEEQVLEMLKKQQSYSQERIGMPLFTAIDEEGGKVSRIAGNSGFDVPSFPYIPEIGAGQDVGRAYELGDSIGEYLGRLGFNLDFAPVADVLSNPENTVVKQRSYGSDPNIVSQMVQENLKGLQKHRVYGCVKHFPGHGATKGDTHEGYAYTDKTWEELSEEDMIPFKDSIAWGVDFVMVGHISLPNVSGDDVPASLSSHMISNLLREELGYDGIVLTDALNMGAITQKYTSSQAAVGTILAGSDMILMPDDFASAYKGVLEAVRDGTITEERLDESLVRILRVKLLLS